MRNEKLAKKIREQPCIVCLKSPVDAEHILPYARDPDKDTEENMWPLCREHHQEKNNSLDDFVRKYRLEEELLNRGFWHDSRRWRKHFTEIK